LRCSFHIAGIHRDIVSLLEGAQRRTVRHIDAREVCSMRLSVLLPASASQSDRKTGLNLPANTASVGSLRNSS
jgi:hypothetical protein